MSVATTHGVEVRVEPTYHPEHSDPPRGRWFFSYTVTITNRREDTVQLLSRRWVITNGRGKQEIVEGSGVVGEQPTLLPGQRFTYTSFCPLDTSLGAMEGAYRMRTNTGGALEVVIPAFTLADPEELN